MSPGPSSLAAGDAPDPDAELVQRVGRGDPAAARTLVAQKLPRLLALATRMLGDRGEAEEVAQESLLRVWRHAASWRPGLARFDTWLHRVALNLCHDRLRRRRWEQPAPQLPEPADPAPLPEQRLAQRGRAQRVAAALRALPERQREAIVLQYYQEMSNVQAAAVMEISVEALESLLARARRSLREALQGERDEP